MIDRSSYMPYYAQIKAYLRKGMEDGDFPVGGKIHSESELMRLFGVSRVTVRQAIEALTQEGYLEKKQGKGTFVRRPKVTQELNVITSWTETMLARGIQLETRSFSCTEILAHEKLAEKLQLPPNSPVYAVERLRYAFDAPICIMKNYISVDIAPGLIKNARIRDGMYMVLEQEYGLELSTAVETIEARAANAMEAEQLLVRRGAPILGVERITYGPDERPIEISIVMSRADKYAYTVRLTGRPDRQ